MQTLESNLIPLLWQDNVLYLNLWLAILVRLEVKKPMCNANS